MTEEAPAERLDPTPNTKRKLYSLSGGYCAFPSCTQFLFNEDVYVGAICHIEAAKPNGPRYNNNQSNEERRSYDNLIIFCKNHHTVVDTDLTTYSVEKLKEIKRNHESKFEKSKLILNEKQSDLIDLEEEVLKMNYLGNNVELINLPYSSNSGNNDSWGTGYFRDEDIASNLDVRRPIVDEIEKELENKNNIMIFGLPFSGKTMILKRVILEYLNRGFSVLYINRIKSNNIILNKLLKRVNTLFKDKLLVVADDLHNPGSSELFTSIKDMSSLKFVFSARKQDFLNMQENLHWNESEIIRLVLESIRTIDIELTDIDAQYFFEKANTLYQKNYSAEEIQAKSRELLAYSKGDLMIFIVSLLASMQSNFDLVKSKHELNLLIERHIKEEHNRVKNLDQRMIFCCMFLGMCGLPLDEELLYKCNIYSEDLKTLQRNNVIISNGTYKAKHELWASIFLQYFFKNQFNEDENRFLRSREKYDETLECIINKLDILDLYKIFDTCRNLMREKESQKFGGLVQKIITDNNYDKNISLSDSKKKADFYCFGLGNYYLLINQYAQAKEFYTTAISYNKDHTSALMNTGSMLFMLRQYTEALSYFERCLEIEDNIHNHNNLIITLIYKGDLEEALKRIDTLLPTHETNFELWNNKGLIKFHSQKYQESIEYFEKSLINNPRYKNAHVNKGLAFANLGDDKTAIESYDKALELDAYYVDAYYSKANSLQNLKRYDESIIFYNKALESNPKHIDSLINMGLSYYEMGEFAKAIEYYDEALKINPQDFVALHNKIRSLSANNENEIALNLCDKIESILKPNDLYWLLLEKATIYEKQGKPNETISCYDSAIQMFPKLTPALQNKGAFLSDIDIHESLKCFHRIVNLQPENIDAYENLTRLYMRLGDANGILYSLSSLIKLSDNPLYRYERAMILIQVGRIPETISDLRYAIKNDEKYRNMALNNTLFKDIVQIINDL